MASVVWLLAAGASAQGYERQPQERNADGGGAPPAMPTETRPAQFSPRDGASPRGGNRLSPEERRQLRRDIHEAGRDLYMDRMPSGRREARRP